MLVNVEYSKGQNLAVGCKASGPCEGRLARHVVFIALDRNVERDGLAMEKSSERRMQCAQQRDQECGISPMPGRHLGLPCLGLGS